MAKSKRFYQISIGSSTLSLPNATGALKDIVDEKYSHIKLDSTAAIELVVLFPYTKQFALSAGLNTAFNTYKNSTNGAIMDLTSTLYTIGASYYSKEITQGWFAQSGLGLAAASIDGDGLTTVSNIGLGYYVGGGYAMHFMGIKMQYLFNFTSTLTTTQFNSMQSMFSIIF